MIQMADLSANSTTRYFLEFQSHPDCARAKMKDWPGDHLMSIIYADAKWLREVVAGNVERFKRLGAKA